MHPRTAMTDDIVEILIGPVSYEVPVTSEACLFQYLEALVTVWMMSSLLLVQADLLVSLGSGWNKHKYTLT